MNRDPFGFRQLLLELAATMLIVSFCLHWAALLLAQVWPWLLGMALTVGAVGVVWRIVRFRQDRW